MDKKTRDIMTGEEHLKEFGFQYAHEFISVADSNIQQVIAIEKHLIAIDTFQKKVVEFAESSDITPDYINEQINKGNLTKDTLYKLLPQNTYENFEEYLQEQSKENKINPSLMGFLQSELSQVQIAKRYLAFHCIGMAFEMLYKTAIERESIGFKKKHPISILHKQLVTSKQEVENIILDHGWQSIEEFTSYFDDYFSDPNVKYFEKYITFQNEAYKHPSQLIHLFYKISESMQKIKYHSTGKWTHPIRLLSVK